MMHYQTIKLEYMFDVAARRLTFSRMMRKPLAFMKAVVICQMVGCTEDSTVKYMVYSAHDDQMLNIMKWLAPTNQEVDYVLYATQLAIELRADPACLASTSDYSCFRVGVRFNGNELAFDGCEESADADGTGCSFVDFMKYLDSIWFYYEGSDDLDAACSVPYVRHDSFGHHSTQ